MTGTELLNGMAQLEKYYQKSYEQFEKDIWYKELKEMSNKRFNQIIQKAYTECKFLPKLADIASINQRMPYIDKLSVDKEQEIKCNKCRSIGLISYIKLIDNGKKYRFVARCTCKNGNQYIYSDKKRYIPSISELGM